MKRNTFEWETVGEIGVDAGLCWIGDPCYIIHPDSLPEDIGKDWDEFCNRLFERESKVNHGGASQWNYDKGHSGLGVTVSTGYGDGMYPVQVRRNNEGRVAEVRVVFIDEDDME